MTLFTFFYDSTKTGFKKVWKQWENNEKKKKRK